MIFKQKQLLCLSLPLLLLFILTSCSNAPKSRYALKHDTRPQRVPIATEMQDPIPRTEDYSRQGNRPYKLFGKSYQIITDTQGYQEQGTASWYGVKFHGHLTSNGEYFDMFNMTAAHKTLPLPSYVRVTNLNNQQQAIVRINDRGPFHGDRIIDLSYAAAYKLGITATGTAPVHLEILSPLEPEIVGEISHQNKASQMHYIQLAASRSEPKLEELGMNILSQYPVHIHIQEDTGLYRLYTGPFQEAEVSHWLLQFQNQGFDDAFSVKLPSPESH